MCWMRYPATANVRFGAAVQTALATINEQQTVGGQLALVAQGRIEAVRIGEWVFAEHGSEAGRWLKRFCVEHGLTVEYLEYSAEYVISLQRAA